MSRTDGPNTATGSVSSSYAQVQAVPARQKNEYLLRVSRVSNPDILQHSSEIPGTPSNTLTSSNSQYKTLKCCECYCTSQYDTLKYSEY